MIMIASVPYNAVIIAHERMSAFAYISVLEVLLKLGMVYLLFFTRTDKLIIYAALLFDAVIGARDLWLLLWASF